MQLAKNTPPFGLVVAHAICSPLQGFFNFLVYMRPRWVTYRKNNPDSTLLQRIRYFYNRHLSDLFIKGGKFNLEPQEEDQYDGAIAHISKSNQRLNHRNIIV